MVDTGLRVHEAVPVTEEVLECIMDYNSCVAITVTDGAPTIVVELLDQIEVQRVAERLVKKLNRCHHIGIGGIALSETAYGIEGLADGITLLPLDRAEAATVVESVLRSRCCR